MKKTKILTVLGVLLAMGITACGGGGKSAEESKPVESQPVESQPAGGSESQPSGDSESQAPSSSKEVVPQKDQLGHIWGADADVAGDAEAGTVTYKRAVCTEEDKAVKLTVDQSLVTLDSGSSRKDGPEGTLKLADKNQSARFKINYDKVAKAKLYLYCCMDGWSSNKTKQAFSYRNAPNIAVTVNENAVDIAALSSVVYTDFLGGDASDYSDNGYGYLGEVLLQKGVNELVYTRLASMNVLVRAFVFVIDQEFDSEWSAPQEVAATASSIAYTKSLNNLTGEVKIEWKALDGTLSEGASIKAGTPEGFLKLNKNTEKVSYAFDFDQNLDGQIYQHGAMDGYAGNGSCTYFSQTKGAKYGNFEMKVNDSIVYYGDKRDVKYSDMLGTEIDDSLVDSTNANNKYSYAKDCLIGDAFLKAGANTASYERVDSYNLAISHFVFIGKPVEKAHVNPAADVAYAGQDADSHWQQVEGDAFKFNRGEHHWVADTDETDTESTCTVKGIKHYKCEVCGMKKTEELELKAHTWVSDPDLASTDTESTCTTHGIAHMVCSVCGAKDAQELPLGPHNFVAGTAVQNSDGKDVTPIECDACHNKGYQMGLKDCFEGSDKIANDGKVTNGSLLKWRFKVGTDVGKVSFMMHAMMNSKGHDNPFSNGGDKGVYTLKAGDKEGTITCAGKSIGADFGATESSAVWFEMGQVEFSAADVDENGEIVISIQFPTTQDYRHKYSEGVRIVFLG